jgi:hypothetical protein
MDFPPSSGEFDVTDLLDQIDMDLLALVPVDDDLQFALEAWARQIDNPGRWKIEFRQFLEP